MHAATRNEMIRTLAIVASLTAVGCAHRVQVQVPATPAISLESARVAVVAEDRSCREVADTLVDELRAMDAFVVDPRAEVRLLVSGCRQSFTYAIDIDHVDGESLRRASVQGRGSALLSVWADGVPQAHLIGAARSAELGERDANDGVALRKTVARKLDGSVATDLAEQVRPVPRLVERRIYPNAANGTARAYVNRAVEAEVAGDFPTAFENAQLAFELDPSREHARYLRELDQILRLRGESAPATD